MSKKALLVAIVFLVFASLATAQWWGFNKDLVNYSAAMQPAWDLVVVIPGTCTVSTTYNGYPTKYHFESVINYPVGDYRFIHWYNPHYDSRTPPNPIPFADTVHIGAWGRGPGFRFVDMYWTNQIGARLWWSVVWNVTTHELWAKPPYNAVDQDWEYGIVFGNTLTPVYENGQTIAEAWASPRPVLIRDVEYAVFNEAVALDLLCGYGIDSLLQPLYLGDTTISPRGVIVFPIPPPEPGQYVVVHWHNFATSVDGSDATCAADWFEYEVQPPNTGLGVDEHGSLEPEFEVTSYHDYAEISYTLPKTGNVSLAVYSVAGERVATLVNETKSAGSYAIRWDASGIPSGVYICYLEADGVKATQKIVLTR